MRKDMLPLYIAIASGVFTLLTTIADNLTKNVKIVLNFGKVTQSASIMPFIMQYAKPILFGSISIVAILVFCIIKFKKT